MGFWVPRLGVGRTWWQGVPVIEVRVEMGIWRALLPSLGCLGAREAGTWQPAPGGLGDLWFHDAVDCAIQVAHHTPLLSVSQVAVGTSPLGPSLYLGLTWKTVPRWVF